MKKNGTLNWDLLSCHDELGELGLAVLRRFRTIAELALPIEIHLGLVTIGGRC